jgi:endonuclease/exonuclease/phosphatase family metal-dependent hydrolase
VVVCAQLLSCASPNYDLRRCTAPEAPRPISSPDVEAGNTLRVVTLNMWGLPMFALDVEARFAALAERLVEADADAVALQEMWDDEARLRLLQAIRHEFPFQVDFQSRHGRGGLVIVARQPFVGEPSFVPFAVTGKWWKPWTGEWWGGKGVGAVRLQLADTNVWLVNTHLHACYERTEGACDETDEYAALRWEQLRTLRATVSALTGDEPAIIVGDFNFTARSAYYRHVVGPGEAHRRGGYDPAWIPVQEPQAPRQRIDHIFVRPGRSRSFTVLEPARVTFAAPVKIEDGRLVPLSDHCAIGATVVETDASGARVTDRGAAPATGKV